MLRGGRQERQVPAQQPIGFEEVTTVAAAEGVHSGRHRLLRRLRLAATALAGPHVLQFVEDEIRAEAAPVRGLPPPPPAVQRPSLTHDPRDRGIRRSVVTTTRRRRNPVGLRSAALQDRVAPAAVQHRSGGDRRRRSAMDKPAATVGLGAISPVLDRGRDGAKNPRRRPAITADEWSCRHAGVVDKVKQPTRHANGITIVRMCTSSCELVRQPPPAVM